MEAGTMPSAAQPPDRPPRRVARRRVFSNRAVWLVDRLRRNRPDRA
jgi:hypothetical protein